MKNKGRKIVEYTYDGDIYKVGLEIGAYQTNNRLYIGFVTRIGECFNDLTINLYGYNLQSNQAFIDVNNNQYNELLSFIQVNNLGTLNPNIKGISGFCEYPVIDFNFDVLSEFDKQGIEQYKKIHKESKSKKLLEREM